MASHNLVVLIGRLGKDPEEVQTKTGKAVARFSLATSERFKDASGQNVEQTDWHRVVMFGRNAEVALQYLSKGSTVMVQGSVRYGRYTDKSGIERHTTDIHAIRMQMLDGKPGSHADTSSLADARLSGRQEAFVAAGVAGASAVQATTGVPADGFDDGIPF